MSETKPQFFVSKKGGQYHRIAYMTQPGRTPGLLWLPGFHSTMRSEKVSELASWCKKMGRAMTRFDYFGHGESDGDPAEGTISTWLNDAREVLLNQSTGPQILVGSSMGGWISLILLQQAANGDKALQDKIYGSLVIAPAWNMTERLISSQLCESDRKALARDEIINVPSKYGERPYPITRILIEDGKKYLLENGASEIKHPLRILHGKNDDVIPWNNSVELQEMLGNASVELTMVEGGDHRLAREEDITLIKKEITRLLEA